MANQADVRKIDIQIEKSSKAPKDKLPQELVDEIAREENMQDREMIMAPLRKLKKAVGFSKGGNVSSASKRADGCAIRGKTKGKMVSMCGGGYMKGKK